MDFTIEGEAGRTYRIRVEEAPYRRADWIQTLLDIDLQTFSEATFSGHAAAALFENGRVFLLCADDIIIGTCVCVRVWDRPDEALMLSMAIRPGWRGRGLGQRFLSGVRDQLASRGRSHTRMTSCVNPDEESTSRTCSTSAPIVASPP